MNSYGPSPFERYHPPKIAIFRMTVFCLKKDFLGQAHWRAWSSLLLRVVVGCGNWVLLVWAGYGLLFIVTPVIFSPKEFTDAVVADPVSAATYFQQCQSLYLHVLPVAGCIIAVFSTIGKTLSLYIDRAEELLISMAKQVDGAQGYSHE